jgi:F420-dependent methylenetetrahydromethanopterin dehydrogenase
LVAARILVTLEDEYRAYREVLAAAIRVLRPAARVESADLEALAEEIERLDPHLVVCSRPNTVDPAGRSAWVELPIDPTRPARVCVGGRYSERTNPTLEVLVGIVDVVEEQLARREGGDLLRGAVRKKDAREPPAGR